MSTTERGILEAKVLPELQAIASSMGVQGYQRLRKADLIGAIIAKAQGVEFVPSSAPSSRGRRASATTTVATGAPGQQPLPGGDPEPDGNGAERGEGNGRPHGDDPGRPAEQASTPDTAAQAPAGTNSRGDSTNDTNNMTEGGTTPSGGTNQPPSGDQASGTDAAPAPAASSDQQSEQRAEAPPAGGDQQTGGGQQAYGTATQSSGQSGDGQGQTNQSQAGQSEGQQQGQDRDQGGDRGQRRNRNRRRNRFGSDQGNVTVLDRPDSRDRAAAPDDRPEVTRVGTLDIRSQDGYGFLRVNGYLPGPDDVYVPLSMIRR